MPEGVYVSTEEAHLRESVRTLLLPFPPTGEHDAIAAFQTALTEAGIDPSDQAQWIRNEREVWRESAAPSKELRNFVEGALMAGNPDFGAALAQSYFKLHQSLQAADVDHGSASALLSQAHVIALFASSAAMSSAQIARVLQASSPQLPVTWQRVESILRELGLSPNLSPDQVTDLAAADQELELDFFADADDATAIGLVANAAYELGVPEEFGSSLSTLFPPDGTPFFPHIQMLHFQCSIAEYYDHPLAVIYEFAPRGLKATALFDLYPPHLVSAGNPFLNNAKSVDVLTEEWARSKKKAQEPSALALVKVLTMLDQMSVSARTELAGLLRRLTLRQIRVLAEEGVDLPVSLTPSEVYRLLASLKDSDTNTRGIIEQRVVDLVASSVHPSEGWVPRGIGDSVNATNVSRMKLGDCDFQNNDARSVVAYEAHGGPLTQVYLDGHVRTLTRALQARSAEWAENFGSDPWTVRVVFIAHRIDVDPSGFPTVEVDNAKATVEAITYEEFLSDVDADDEAVRSLVADLLLQPLSERRTPEFARERLLEVIAGT